MNFGSEYSWIPKDERDEEEEVFDEDIQDGLEKSAVRDDIEVNQTNVMNNQQQLPQFLLQPNQLPPQQQFPPQQNQLPMFNSLPQQQYIPRRSEAKRKVKGANTNVIGLELGKLGDAASIATGDAQFCKQCQAMFNSFSVLERPQVQENTNQGESGEQKWRCEFCGFENAVEMDEQEIPKEAIIDYLLEPAQEIQQNEGDSNTVLFIIDISGSMCVTTEVQGKISLKGGFNPNDFSQHTGGENQWMPNQNRNVTYISRLQCVQASIEKQIQSFVKENPNKKVGLITFSNEVTVLGDGTSLPVIIGGDKLNNFETLLEEGKKLTVANPVKQTHKELVNKLYKLQESGTTALGPALVVGLGMVSNLGKGSTIVLLTDGLANVGVGSMEELYTEEQQQQAENFYRRVGEAAEKFGASISITGIEGSECKMENLGLVTELSNGEVDIVNPLELTNNFSNILSKTIVATECNLIFKVHKGMKIRDDDTSEGSETLQKNVGNVTNDMTCTFEYSLKSYKELKELDLDKLKEIPFQVQIYFRDIAGAKKVRCITKQQKITNDKQEAEKKIDIKVVSANAVQGSAKLAQKGEYKLAREKMLLNQKLMNRNCVDYEQRSQYSNFVSKAVQLDNALLEEEKNEEMEQQNTNDRPNTKSRRNKRNDNLSKNIYQAKKWK